jgi:ubiquinone/menaquinone biosynthesis C-methylase UbiE
MSFVPTPREPQLSLFRDLIRQGAGTLDKHDQQDAASPFVHGAHAYEALVEREVNRVEVHLRSLCQLLEAHVGPVDDVLDLGCGTGATTVAIALSPGLRARRVVGADPNDFSLRAAQARWESYAPADDRVAFERIAPGEPLPSADESFGLTICISVLEYLGDSASRQTLAHEMLRVTRRGGHVCLVTPNPMRLFDYHTHRLLGDWRRTAGYPWASPPWALARLFKGHRVRFLLGEQLAHGLAKRRFPGARLLAHAAPLAWLLPWQKIIVTRA